MNSVPVRVCSFESRRGPEMKRLIEKFGGTATIAPSMQEIPLESNQEAHDFVRRLIAGEIDIVVFMTGVGTDALYEAVESQVSSEELSTALAKTTIAVRGPKPTAALAKRGVIPDLRAPEPNTWRELVGQFQQTQTHLAGTRIAIQEYGKPSDELHEWLRAQGADVTPVTIYRWALPEDVTPLQTAIRSTITGEFDLLLWTSAQQVVHTFQVAHDLELTKEWIDSASNTRNASIGPTCSERLREYGIEPFMEPSHPKMAHLVREAIAAANS